MKKKPLEFANSCSSSFSMLLFYTIHKEYENLQIEQGFHWPWYNNIQYTKKMNLKNLAYSKNEKIRLLSQHMIQKESLFFVQKKKFHIQSMGNCVPKTSWVI
jgi:hypothetical protein